MGGWEEEVFFSKYCVGMLQALLGYPSEECIKTHSEAYEFRQTRSEPLYRVAEQYMRSGNFSLALIIANYGLTIPLSNDSVFVEQWIYDWGLRIQVMECLYRMGKIEQAYEQIQFLLSTKTLPEKTRMELNKSLNLLQRTIFNR